MKLRKVRLVSKALWAAVAVAVIPIAALSSGIPAVAASPSLQAADSTTSLSLRLLPTYESISVYFSFGGDGNANNQALLEYRRAGTPRWIVGMDMTADRRDTIDGSSNPWKNQWRASILLAQPNTDYEVRVTVADPDGVVGSPVTQTVRTWRETDQIPADGNAIYVATNGSDTTGDGSEANPYQTIQKAADLVNPGDTAYIKAGTYVVTDEIALTRSGQPDNYITFRNFGNDEVIVDVDYLGRCAGSSSPRSCAFAVYGSYIVLRGFTINQSNVSSSTRGINIRSPAHDVIVQDLLIEVVGDGSLGILISSGGSTPVSERPHSITVERTKILVYEPGEVVSQSVGPGIDVEYGGGQFVFRNNHIQYFGTLETHGRDCFVAHPNFVAEAGFWDTDIYNNVCIDGTDDAVSLDGGSSNARVWGNYFSGTMVGVSIAPVLVGPSYVFRNVVDGLKQQWKLQCFIFKIGEGGTGQVYVYQNTFYAPDRLLGAKECKRIDGLAHGANPLSRNIDSYNNIWVFNGRAVSDKGEKPIMDYNLYWEPNTENWSKSFARWAGNTYSTFDSFRAGTGQEANGIWGQATFVDQPGGDFRLVEGSLGIDAGTIIQGFNDPDSAWPFTGAAPDMGAFEAPEPDPNAPPFRYSPSPAGDELDPGTTQASLSLKTSKLSTCKYSDTPGVDYDSMSRTFEGTGGTVHSTPVTGLQDGNSYAYYVRCKAVTANPDDLLIGFSVRVPDTIPPAISNLQSNLVASSLTVSWHTDKNSTGVIEYGLSPTSLAQSASSSSLAMSHAVVIRGLASETTYYYRVSACNRDNYCSQSLPGVVTTGVFVTVSSLTVTSGQTYQVVGAGLVVGADVYVDRSFTFSSVPSGLAGATYIQTANGDKARTDSSLLSFSIDGDATVYVSYDTRATSLPDWLAGWTSTGDVIGTTDVDHNLYSRDYAAGAVSLGGNMATGASGAESNYVVVVGASGSEGIVEPPPTMPTLPGLSSPVRDLDGDGLAEDINGNGRRDYADVVSLFVNQGAPEIVGNSELFDFDGSGAFNMGDIVELFRRVAGP